MWWILTRPDNEANISRRLRLSEGYPYRLVKLDLFLQVQLHDPVVVIDTIAMEVVHLSCGGGKQRGGTAQRESGVMLQRAPPLRFHAGSYLAMRKTWCWLVWPWWLCLEGWFCWPPPACRPPSLCLWRSARKKWITHATGNIMQRINECFKSRSNLDRRQKSHDITTIEVMRVCEFRFPRRATTG